MELSILETSPSMPGYEHSSTEARDDERTEDRDALSASISGLQPVSIYQQRRLKSLLHCFKASDTRECCLVCERSAAWLRGALVLPEDNFSWLAATACAPLVTVG